MRRTVVLLTSLALMASCQEVTGPKLELGYYGAATINGQSGQVLVGATATCDELLWKTALFLNEDGTFSFGGLRMHDCTRGGGDVTVTVVNLPGTWVRSHDQLILDLPGAAPFTATFDDGHLSTTVPAAATALTLDLRIDFTWFQVPPP